MDITRIRTKADYDEAYRLSIEDPEGFWAAQAETFTWRKKWDKVLEWDFQRSPR
jgi:acetyl-CoA synthetase